MVVIFKFLSFDDYEVVNKNKSVFGNRHIRADLCYVCFSMVSFNQYITITVLINTMVLQICL